MDENTSKLKKDADAAGTILDMVLGGYHYILLVGNPAGKETVLVSTVNDRKYIRALLADMVESMPKKED